MNTSLMIENLDDATWQRLQDEAHRRRIDVANLAADILRKEAGTFSTSPSSRITDITAFGGTWSAEEAAAFLDSISELERIDAELWK